jgi:hypothetical protein
MRCPIIETLCLLILVAGVCLSQTPPIPAPTSSYIDIRLPPGFDSGHFFVRYLLAGDDFGGWIQPRPNVSSYAISTTHEGRPANRIRALLYAPGCAIEVLDLPVSYPGSQPYSFICRSLPDVPLAGTIIRTDRLFGRKVRLQAYYVARWASSFLGIADEIVTLIPIGETNDISASGGFRLSLPDLSHDALAGSPEHSGEIQIWAREAATDKIVAQLIPVGPETGETMVGGLKIQAAYPSETVFAPCAANNPRVRDANGFALRPGAEDICDR